jgi:hypothetical protein
LAASRTHVAVAGAGVVRADRRARLAAEEIDHATARGLADEVPEGDVDRRVPARLDTGGSGADVVLESDPERIQPGRILSDEAADGRLVEVRLDLGGAEERLAEADEPGVRMEPHEEDVGKLTQPDCLDARDAHVRRAHLRDAEPQGSRLEGPCTGSVRTRFAAIPRDVGKNTRSATSIAGATSIG